MQREGLKQTPTQRSGRETILLPRISPIRPPIEKKYSLLSKPPRGKLLFNSNWCNSRGLCNKLGSTEIVNEIRRTTYTLGVLHIHHIQYMGEEMIGLTLHRCSLRLHSLAWHDRRRKKNPSFKSSGKKKTMRFWRTASIPFGSRLSAR